jgi:O-antigen/teichoic acid export membrane protein
MSTEKRTGIARDILWYSIGFVIPMLLGFIKTPIFTRYFTPEEYGYLSIVSNAFNYITIFTFAWLASCIWRYYNQYKENRKLQQFYSNILFLYLISSAVLVLVSSLWISISQSSATNILVLLLCLQTILSQFIDLHMVMIRLERQSLKYNIITIFMSSSGFTVLLFLTFVLRLRIEAAVISTVIINVLILIYILFSTSYKGYISISCISYDIIREFLKYGGVTVVSALSLIVLTSSDRYVIALLKNMKAVGIYNQVYGLSEISIIALVRVYINSINPILFKELESNLKNYRVTLYKFTNIYILYLLPAAVYFSLFSKQIAIILLGEEFRSGYRMMPYIMFTAFIYGMSEFIHDIFKFSNKLMTLVRGIIIAALVNIVLNFMLLPFFNYQIAAVTTLAAYLVLYLYDYYNDNTKYFHCRDNIRIISPYVAILIAQVLLDQILRKLLVIDINVIFTILEGILFSAFYYTVLQRKQIHLLVKKAKRRIFV